MATLNGVPFRQMLVSEAYWSVKCPYPMKPTSITVHNTDNQMPAVNEITFMSVTNRNAETSYHVAVDEKEAIQGIPFNRNAWHSGDGGSGAGNRTSIGVEICRNFDRSRWTTNLTGELAEQYKQAEENAVKVIAQLCINFGIVASVSTIRSHKERSGKNCPQKMYNDGTWDLFRQRVINEYNRLVKGGKPASIGQDKITADTYKVKSGDTLSAIAIRSGVSIEDLVKLNGIGNKNVISVGQVLKIRLPKPAPKPVAKPSTVSQKAVSYAEEGSFKVTDNKGIIVRSKPSVSATQVATYEKGEILDKYVAVHYAEGYVWLEYNRSGGKGKGYMPIRTHSKAGGKDTFGTPWGEVGKVGQFKPTPAPKPVPPKAVAPKVVRYEEVGSFKVTDSKGINVRNKPSLKGTKLAVYAKGEVLDKYIAVHYAEGYVWLEYDRSGGRGKGYLPIRTHAVKNGKDTFGAPWGQVGKLGQF